MQKGGLLEHGDRTRGQTEMLRQVVRDGRLCTLRLGEGEVKGVMLVSKEFWKQGLQDLEGLASCCWEKGYSLLVVKIFL